MGKKWTFRKHNVYLCSATLSFIMKTVFILSPSTSNCLIVTYSTDWACPITTCQCCQQRSRTLSISGSLMSAKTVRTFLWLCLYFTTITLMRIILDFQRCSIWLRKKVFSHIVMASLANKSKATRKKEFCFYTMFRLLERYSRGKNATACFSLTTYYVTALHDLKFLIKEVGKLRPAAHKTTSSWCTWAAEWDF